MRETLRRDAAWWGVVVVLLLQFGAGCWFFGGLSERVKAVEKNTQVLIEMHLEKRADK